VTLTDNQFGGLMLLLGLMVGLCLGLWLPFLLHG
jgi:hypothetical protein